VPRRHSVSLPGDRVKGAYGAHGAGCAGRYATLDPSTRWQELAPIGKQAPPGNRPEPRRLRPLTPEPRTMIYYRSRAPVLR
jgi:hypothetical protein